MIGTTPVIFSHRGNMMGAYHPNDENKFNSIRDAIKYKFNVEIDIWQIGTKYFLGHDAPDYLITLEYLEQLKEKTLFHAKNLQALESLLIGGYHVFWHQNDDFALTSRNFIVTYPGQPLTYRSIVMQPEKYTVAALKGVYAICTDYPLRWKEVLCNLE